VLALESAVPSATDSGEAPGLAGGAVDISGMLAAAIATAPPAARAADSDVGAMVLVEGGKTPRLHGAKVTRRRGRSARALDTGGVTGGRVPELAGAPPVGSDTGVGGDDVLAVWGPMRSEPSGETVASAEADVAAGE
jgi:hypothetical protein